MTEAMTAVANQLGVAQESVRRWVTQAAVDAGDRPGLTSAEHEEIKRLKAEKSTVARGRGDPEGGHEFLRGCIRPPQPLIMGFIDTMRAEGHAVESVCRVLREHEPAADRAPGPRGHPALNRFRG